MIIRTARGREGPAAVRLDPLGASLRQRDARLKRRNAEAGDIGHVLDDWRAVGGQPLQCAGQRATNHVLHEASNAAGLILVAVENNCQRLPRETSVAGGKNELAKAARQPQR